MGGSLDVIFRYPGELELVFTYIERQKQVLEAQGQPMLPYRIELGEREIVVKVDLKDANPDDPFGLGGSPSDLGLTDDGEEQP